MKRGISFLVIFLLLIAVGAFAVLVNTTFTGNVIEESTDSVETTVYFYAGNMLASKTENQDYDFYLQDHLGSNKKVTRGESIDQANTFYAFGETKTAGANDNDYKYTGKELDEETDLYYYGARYYSPELGRFVSADAVQGKFDDPASMNRFAYTKNNPLKYIDPSGNKIEASIANRIVEALNKVLGEKVFKKEALLSENIVMENKDYEGDENQMKIFNMVKDLIESEKTLIIKEVEGDYELGEEGYFYDSFSGVGLLSLSFSDERLDLGEVGEGFSTYLSDSEGAIVHELAHAHGTMVIDSPGEDYAVEMENVYNEIAGHLKREYYDSKTYIEKDSSGKEYLIMEGITPDFWDAIGKEDFRSRGKFTPNSRERILIVKDLPPG